MCLPQRYSQGHWQLLLSLLATAFAWHARVHPKHAPRDCIVPTQVRKDIIMIFDMLSVGLRAACEHVERDRVHHACFYVLRRGVGYGVAEGDRCTFQVRSRLSTRAAWSTCIISTNTEIAFTVTLSFLKIAANIRFCPHFCTFVCSEHHNF